MESNVPSITFLELYDSGNQQMKKHKLHLQRTIISERKENINSFPKKKFEKMRKTVTHTAKHKQTIGCFKRGVIAVLLRIIFVFFYISCQGDEKQGLKNIQSHHTMGQNSQKYRLKYWATRSSIRLHRSLVHLLRNTRFARALARSLHSLPSSWERE